MERGSYYEAIADTPPRDPWDIPRGTTDDPPCTGLRENYHQLRGQPNPCLLESLDCGKKNCNSGCKGHFKTCIDFWAPKLNLSKDELHTIKECGIDHCTSGCDTSKTGAFYKCVKDLCSKHVLGQCRDNRYKGTLPRNCNCFTPPGLAPNAIPEQPEAEGSDRNSEGLGSDELGHEPSSFTAPPPGNPFKAPCSNKTCATACLKSGVRCAFCKSGANSKLSAKEDCVCELNTGPHDYVCDDTMGGAIGTTKNAACPRAPPPPKSPFHLVQERGGKAVLRLRGNRPMWCTLMMRLLNYFKKNLFSLNKYV